MTYLIMSGTYTKLRKQIKFCPKIYLIKKWSGNIFLPRTDRPNHFMNYRERWSIGVALFKIVWK